MAATRKALEYRLTAAERAELHHLLRERWMLLLRLRDLSMKRLAGRFGIHRQTLQRLDESIHGVHLEDPSLRCVKRSEIEEVSM